MLPPKPLPQTPSGALLRPDLWPALLEAAVRLAKARRDIRSSDARSILRAARDFPLTPVQGAATGDVIKISWAITRMGPKVPWRADCLVQALAAQRWLARCGMHSDLHVGVRTDGPDGFAAHAWLTHGDMIVTGGDISGFTPLISPDAPLPDDPA